MIPLNLMGAAPARTKGSRVMCYPRIGSFRISIAQSPLIHIDQPKAVHITCNSGSNDIERAEIRLRAGSAGLRLRTADVKPIRGTAVVRGDFAPGIIRLSELRRNDTSIFQIQYELENSLAEVSIKVDATYFTSAGEFQLASTIVLPVELSLDVNVLDQFKDQSMLSKFNIRTANNVPLQVTDIELEGTDQFSIADAPIIGLPFFVFPKQPAVFTYKIKPRVTKEGTRIPRMEAKEPPLELTVTYRCLDQDVITYVERRFGEDIAKSPFRKLSSLLVPSFVDRVKHRLIDQMEAVALVRRMRLGNFQDMSWSECLEGLSPSIRDEVRMWLERWHQVRDLPSPSGT
jgi:trafficking protein particle complex subunit 10